MLVYLTLFCCMLAETFVRDFMSPNSSITEWIWNSEYVGIYMIILQVDSAYYPDKIGFL